MPSALSSGAIQGYITGAPVWLPSVQNGFGVVWLSGPQGDFPTESAPVSSSGFVALREFVDQNPDITQRLAAVFADFVKVLNERPEEFKKALSRAYPTLAPADLDVLFKSEAGSWKIKDLTAADIKQDIGFVKASGIKLQPEIDNVDPAKVVLQAR